MREKNYILRAFVFLGWVVDFTYYQYLVLHICNNDQTLQCEVCPVSSYSAGYNSNYLLLHHHSIMANAKWLRLGNKHNT